TFGRNVCKVRNDHGRIPAISITGATLIGMSSRDDDAPDGAASEPWQKQLTALGGFIRMQRRLADMSLREMASLTSVSNAYLSQIERSLHQPSLRVLRSIAQALSIAPEDLLRRAPFIAPRDTSDEGATGDEAPPAYP